MVPDCMYFSLIQSHIASISGEVCKIYPPQMRHYCVYFLLRKKKQEHRAMSISRITIELTEVVRFVDFFKFYYAFQLFNCIHDGAPHLAQHIDNSAYTFYVYYLRYLCFLRNTMLLDVKKPPSNDTRYQDTKKYTQIPPVYARVRTHVCVCAYIRRCICVDVLAQFSSGFYHFYYFTPYVTLVVTSYLIYENN